MKPRRVRIRWIALALVGGVLLWDATALAFNAVVSQDLPVLIEILSTEVAQYGELGSILAETSAMVEQVKEYTSVAKVAWGAVDELRHMTLDDLKDAALLGTNRAFPELGRMYGDIEDIRDLDYRDPAAVETFRGILWEHAYGPAVDYLHSAHENHQIVANAREHRARQSGKVMARRIEAEIWEEDCRRTADGGFEGACQAAANRAEILHAILLTDLHETALASLELQEQALMNDDRRELDQLYEYDRFLFDAANYVSASAGIEGKTCAAGRCLWERYGARVGSKIADYRARHQRPYPHRLPAEFGLDFSSEPEPDDRIEVLW